MAESVLLDVRTGIVVQTARSAEGIATRKLPGDLNFSETVAKAQSGATGKALVKLAGAVVTYLKEIRTVHFWRYRVDHKRKRKNGRGRVY